jgi:hypothetical protein
MLKDATLAGAIEMEMEGPETNIEKMMLEAHYTVWYTTTECQEARAVLCNESRVLHSRPQNRLSFYYAPTTQSDSGTGTS